MDLDEHAVHAGRDRALVLERHGGRVLERDPGRVEDREGDGRPAGSAMSSIAAAW